MFRSSNHSTMSDTALAIPTKEVEEEVRSITPVTERAHSLTIESPDDVREGEALLTRIKDAKKALTARKEEITRPFMTALSSVRDLFKGPETILSEAERMLKVKMLDYNAHEEERIQAVKDKAEKDLASGRIKHSTAVAKTMEAGTATKMKTRTVTKVRIVDETLIPREFLIPDMKAITKAMIESDVAIPGVEKYKEKILAA